MPPPRSRSRALGPVASTLPRTILLSLVVLFIGLAAFAFETVERRSSETAADLLESRMQAIRHSIVLWSDDERLTAETWASIPQLPAIAKALAAAVHEDKATPSELRSRPEARELERLLATEVRADHLSGYLMLDTTGLAIAGSAAEMVGGNAKTTHRELVDRVLAGESVVSSPYSALTPLPDENGILRSGLPTMFAAAPIRDERGRVVGVLGLRLRPEGQLRRLLTSNRQGQTAETYLFDRDGMMLTESRFDEQLRRAGLMAGDTTIVSALHIQVRDPGGDVTKGFSPTMPMQDRPLTYAAQHALAGETGLTLSWYRDYRGRPVVGAWTWIPQLDAGLIYEMDDEEALSLVMVLRRVLAAMIAIVTIAGVVALLQRREMETVERKRRAAEDELKMREETLSAIIDSSPNSVLILDDIGNIARANAMANQHFGTRGEPVTGMLVSRFIACGVPWRGDVQSFLEAAGREAMGIRPDGSTSRSTCASPRWRSAARRSTSAS